MQRLAGNAAVSAVLDRISRDLAVQRWVGPEHEELGHESGGGDVDLGSGLILTWGQVVAVAGDEYPTLKALREDAKSVEGRVRIRAALEHAEVAGAGGSHLPAPTEAQKAEHLKEYQLLALENVSHFAGEGASITSWEEYHTEALLAALKAGFRGRPDEMGSAHASEAFGEHFLTDSFSGGHVRVPRGSIIDWYKGAFAPRVVGHLVADLKRQMVEELFKQAQPQISWYQPDSMVHDKIASNLNQKIDAKIAAIGGLQVVSKWVGLAVAGAVSGALHDMEGERGVWVSSKAHPQPFQAFGDAMLDDPRNNDNRDQAVLAMKMAQDDLSLAFRLGEGEAAASDVTIDELPSVVYFGFDSSAVDPRASALLALAGQYMVHHPEVQAEVMGHTDPIGTAAYNDKLGRRRAEVVADLLLKAGASSTQVRTMSAGKTAPVTKEPRRYHLDRRTAVVWRTDPIVQYSPFKRALVALGDQVGPPYQRVRDLIPRPVDVSQGASPNVALEEWRWGSMPPNLVRRLEIWVHGRVTAADLGQILATQELDDQTQSGITVRPRDAAQKVLGVLLANPMDFLAKAFGVKPGA